MIRVPAARKSQQGVVFFRCADGNPHAVGAVRADHDARISGLLHEVQGAGSQWQPDEVGLGRRQREPGAAQLGADPDTFADDGVGTCQQLIGGVQEAIAAACATLDTVNGT